jgi:hypothetical protein
VLQQVLLDLSPSSGHDLAAPTLAVLDVGCRWQMEADVHLKPPSESELLSRSSLYSGSDAAPVGPTATIAKSTPRSTPVCRSRTPGSWRVIIT